MKKLAIGLGLLVGLSVTGNGMAQSPDEKDKYEKDAPISTGRSLLTPADIVHRRAVQEAMEREARIENRHWHGISLQRPAVYAGPSAGIEFLYATPWRTPLSIRASYWEWAQ